MTQQDPASYPVDKANRIRRHPERGSYDHATVHAVLDAAIIAHVSYVVDGQPLCTPTLFWREDSRLYWHGSNSSRMLQILSRGELACLTATHLDALVLARSAFHHSADYRSVMAFGHPRLVTDSDEKAQALVMMVDRLYPGRTAQLRTTTLQELNATTVVAMDIERASAKVRALGVVDDAEDVGLPIYAERLPVQTLIGQPEPCASVLPGIGRPNHLDGYRPGRSLEEAVTEAHANAYAENTGGLR